MQSLSLDSLKPVAALAILAAILAVSIQAAGSVAIIAYADDNYPPPNHAPIVIIGDDNFTPENGVSSGSGTEEDPYIIENLVIEVNESQALVENYRAGILLKDTSSYVVIKNVTIYWTGGSKAVGILLYNSSHVRIEDTRILSIDDYGIRVGYANDVKIVKTLVRDINDYDGIYVFLSNNTIIDKSVINNTDDNGIRLEGVRNATIRSTIVSGAGDRAIYVSYYYKAYYGTIESSSILVTGNNITGTLYLAGVEGGDINITGNSITGTIELSSSESRNISSIAVVNNTITFSGDPDGKIALSIPADRSVVKDIVVSNNTITNHGYGIQLSGSQGSPSASVVIANNTICNTSYYGIKLNSVMGARIIGNILKNTCAECALVIEGGYEEARASITIGGNSSGISIEANTITRSRAWGIKVESSVDPSTIAIHYNNIYGNGGGLLSTAGAELNASLNWWGDVSGPGGEGAGAGDIVVGNVVYAPWLDSPYPGGEPISASSAKESMTLGAGETRSFNAKSTADTEVIVSASSGVNVTIGVLEYPRNPVETSPPGQPVKYIDVNLRANTTSPIDSIIIRIYLRSSEELSGLVPYWWDGSMWREFSNYRLVAEPVNGYSGYMELRVSDDTIPSIEDLVGTVVVLAAGGGGAGPAGGGAAGQQLVVGGELEVSDRMGHSESSSYGLAVFAASLYAAGAILLAYYLRAKSRREG